MKDVTPRTIIAYVIIGTYTCLTVVAVIYPVLGIRSFDLEKFSAYFSKISGAFTGLVGVIIGYYFGKSDSNQTGSTGPEAGLSSPTPPNPTVPQPTPEQPVSPVPESGSPYSVFDEDQQTTNERRSSNENDMLAGI
ncbi:hypothetical protein [Mucilaginibacter rubeus]|uniref:Uncharacterized protein n=1 Tax=Mucilaginibacter rubeus TaxID=2027860 RepID=A0A5C1I1G9_9SPHI|nr:hypothetical protein [Mucilaginibacter rubeus]QEM11158.1 hypothetical protein DEO27_014385 [Mucilaginibacter rubeus]